MQCNGKCNQENAKCELDLRCLGLKSSNFAPFAIAMTTPIIHNPASIGHMEMQFQLSGHTYMTSAEKGEEWFTEF